MTQICWIENRTPGVGLRPPLVMPYGIPSGADTILPALFHGSTCFISVTDFLDISPIENIFDWLCTTYPAQIGLDYWSLIEMTKKKLIKSLFSYTLLVCNWLVSYCQKVETEISFIFGKNWQGQNISVIWYVEKFFSEWEENTCYKYYNGVKSI